MCHIGFETEPIYHEVKQNNPISCGETEYRYQHILSDHPLSPARSLHEPMYSLYFPRGCRSVCMT